MKRNLYISALLAMLLPLPGFISSCKKTISAPGDAWIFKGVTHPDDITYYNPHGVVAVSDTNTATSASLDVYFFDNVLPTASGTYTVVNPPLHAANQVYILAFIKPQSDTAAHYIQYLSTGGNGTQTIQVSVSGGITRVGGGGIEMFNEANPADSATLSLNISQ